MSSLFRLVRSAGAFGSPQRPRCAYTSICLLFASCVTVAAHSTVAVVSIHVHASSGSFIDSSVQDSPKRAPDLASKAPEWLKALEGNWVNVDPQTPDITRFSLVLKADTVTIHMWARCQHTECDWGEVTVTLPRTSANVLRLEWPIPYGVRHQELRPEANGRVHVKTNTQYTDVTRKPFETEHLFHHPKNQWQVSIFLFTLQRVDEIHLHRLSHRHVH